MDTSSALPIELRHTRRRVSHGDGSAAGEQAGRGARRRYGVWVALAAVALCTCAVLLYLRTWPPLAIVQSGSMAPTIRTGDLVLLKHIDGPPRVGEIVAITVPDAVRARYGYPPVVTHRIVRIAPGGQITTKGDALKAVDPFTTPRAAVTTEVAASVPAVGRAFAFLTSTLGMLWLGAGALLLLVLPQLERRRAREESERDAIGALHEKLEALSEELAAIGEAVASRPDLEPRLQPPDPQPPEPEPPEPEPPEPEPPEPAPPTPAPVRQTYRKRSGGLVGTVLTRSRAMRRGAR